MVQIEVCLGDQTNSKAKLRLCIRIFLLAVFGVLYAYDATQRETTTTFIAVHCIE